MPVPRQAFYQVGADGLEPIAGGTLQFFIVGTSTPKAVYADPDGATSLGTEITLDADGYAPAIYLDASGYKVTLLDAEAVQIWSVDGVEDVGAAFLASMGLTFYAGSKDVENAYAITEDDYLVTVNESVTDPATVALPPAAGRTQDITIKNMGPTTVAITPDGAETIEGVAAAYVIPAAASPNFPTVTLRPDGVSNYLIVSSHGL